MRKTIALVLAMLMVLSIVPFAFAENETNSTDGDSVVPDVDNSTDGDDDGTGESGEDTDEPDDSLNETEEPEAEPEDEAEDNETEEPEAEPEDEAEDNETEEPELEEEEEEDVVEIPENVTQEAGITPDSFLWGLERAIERVSLSLTFGKSAKAKKGLAHARERLMEVQVMIAAKRLANAGEAHAAYEDTMDEVGENVEGMGNGDALGELEDEAELEAALAQNEELVQATNRVRMKLKGLTEEQEAQVNSIIGGLGDSTADIKVEVQVKKNKTKIKLKAKGDLTDEEVASIAAQIEEAVARGEKAKIQIKNKNNNKKGGDDDETESEGEDENEGDNESDDDDEEDDDDVNATSSKGNNKKPKKEK